MDNLKLVKSFEKETICGYDVSEKMKKIWNVELNILHVFQKICKDNGLTYYAIGGTLLGAIRHKGYIPWDNDIDVGMPRNDYMRFLEIAPDSIKYPLFVQSYRSERSFTYDMVKIRDCRTSGFTENDKINKGNKGIFFDIFPLDNIPDDKELEQKENRKHGFQFHLISFTSRKGSYHGKTGIILNLIRGMMIRIICQRLKQYFFDRMIADSSKYNSTKTAYCGLRLFWRADKYRWRNEDVAEMIDVPFEGTSIAVPKGYDRILTDVYGDYNKFVIGGSNHEGVFLDPDVPFEELLKGR